MLNVFGTYNLLVHTENYLSGFKTSTKFFFANEPGLNHLNRLDSLDRLGGFRF